MLSLKPLPRLLKEGRICLHYGMQLNLGKFQRALVARYVKLFYNVLNFLLVTVEQLESKRLYKLDFF